MLHIFKRNNKLKTVLKILCIALCLTWLIASWKTVANLKTVPNLTRSRSKGDAAVEYFTERKDMVNKNSTKTSCEPRKHFAFTKTHKTASTTVMELFSGFAKKHDFPQNACAVHPLVGGYPGRVDQRFLLELVDGKFQRMNESVKTEVVLYRHFRFDAGVLRKIMFSDAVFFTILRQPWHQFQSTYNFFYYGKPPQANKLKVSCFPLPFYQIARGDVLSIFQYLVRAGTALDSSVPWFFRSTNYQSHDLGLDPTLIDDSEIEREIKKLSTELDFVMIAEYFDESLILLKELLCMDWSDLLHTRKRVKKYTKYSLDENLEASKIFRKLFKMDLALYKHFNDTFWQKVDAYGREQMVKDVSKLHQLQSRYEQNQDLQEKDDRKDHIVDTHNPPLMNAQLTPETISKKPSRTEMLKLLEQRISTQSDLLPPSAINDLAEYMVDNSGGCPI